MPEVTESCPYISRQALNAEVCRGRLDSNDSSLDVLHLQKISRNFGGNFHRVKNEFHLTQVRSPPSDCDFTQQNLKMWP